MNWVASMSASPQVSPGLVQSRRVRGANGFLENEKSEDQRCTEHAEPSRCTKARRENDPAGTDHAAGDNETQSKMTQSFAKV